MPADTAGDPAMKIPPGMKVDDVVIGTGRIAEPHTMAVVHYDCFVRGGERLRSTRDCTAHLAMRCGGHCARPHGPIEVKIGRRACSYEALYLGILGMRVGGVRRILVEPHLSRHERRGHPQVPSDSLLDYQIELIDVKDEPPADAARRRRLAERKLERMRDRAR